jgi:hypothetical protein
MDPVSAAYHREPHDPPALPLEAHTRHLGFRVDLDRAGDLERAPLAELPMIEALIKDRDDRDALR